MAQAEGKSQEAIRTFKTVLLGYPLTNEALSGASEALELGAEASLTSTELRGLADAYYKAGRYEEAGEEYRALA